MSDDIEEALTALTKKIHEEQLESPQYKTLATATTVNELLRRAEHLMLGVALDTVMALKEVHGIDVDREAYNFLLGLPEYRSDLQKEYAAVTHVGSVDQAFATLTAIITKGQRT